MATSNPSGDLETAFRLLRMGECSASERFTKAAMSQLQTEIDAVELVVNEQVSSYDRQLRAKDKQIEFLRGVNKGLHSQVLQYEGIIRSKPAYK